MGYSRRFLLSFLFCFAGVLISVSISPVRTAAQQIDPSFYSAMRWRLIGPYRAGRVTAVAGIPGNPAVYYMGTPGGGVWKTTDGGTFWKPIFDSEHVASIGAVALAPSDTRIVYVGTGEQTQGNGVYKSTDAGATWTQIGLQDTHFINIVLVDPRNPNIVIVGAMGDGTPSDNRGVYKTTDGGKSWKKTLFQDNMTGVADMVMDPGNPRILYAAMWHPLDRLFFARPEKPVIGPDAWIYKSTDEGSTWKRLDADGMPSGKWGRTGLAVAPGNHGKRVFAIVAQGLYRSDDAGANWRQITKDPRVVGNSYFSRIFVDPKNADTVYVMQTCSYRSTDGGGNFEAFKGAPDGDDYHVLWIDPTNPDRMILGVDQGATISMDDGKTWSPWYNQPTGQLYHLSAGNEFPYIIYASEQDSGSVAIPSRSDFGRIRNRDVFSPDGYEFGYIVEDPVHPYLVYADGSPGTVVRLDRRTNQATTVFSAGTKYHVDENAPLGFSPADPNILYFGTQYVLESTDGAATWHEVSPDLGRRSAETQGRNQSASRPGPRNGVISALAPSPISPSVMWAGTTNGLVQVTRDAGATWQNVSPPELTDRSLVSIVEASSHDPATAYLAVDQFQDEHPHFFRTHDYGKTWQAINNGMPQTGIARMIREDTVRKGLLYAGTETGVFVSFDDGDNWQSLQLNLPTSSVRDLIVHGDDLAVATYGRSLWVLDDVTPLRQATEQLTSNNVYFYRPETAIRTIWDDDQDTPLPPEVPAGKNPPDGAFIDYYLKSAPQGEITLSISDSAGNLIRTYTSAAPPPEKRLPVVVPDYWFMPPVVLSKNAGMNRFVWNLRYPHPKALPYGIFPPGLQKFVQYYGTQDAVPGATPFDQPLGPLVVPGDYQLALTVDGQTFRQTLHVVKDPRETASEYDYVEQFNLIHQMTNGMDSTYDAYHQLEPLNDALEDRIKSLKANPQAKDALDAATAFQKKLALIQGGGFASPGFGMINSDLTQMVYAANMGDGAPAQTVQADTARACEALTKDFDAWQKLNGDVASLNDALQKYNLAPLPNVELNTLTGGCAK